MKAAEVEKALSEVGELLLEDRPIDKDISNEDLHALYSVAYTLYESGDYEQAKPLFQQLTSLKPFEYNYWLGLAACWQMEKSYTEALQGWAMASLINGEDPLPHYHAAECYRALNNGVEGMKAVRMAKEKLGSKQPELRKRLETLELSWKQDQGA